MAESIDFPNESSGYREARKRLLVAEVALRGEIERVAKLRRELPVGGAVPEDYTFSEMASGAPRHVRLSELFAAGKDSLFLYSFMYGPQMERACPMCTSFLDALEAQAAHLEQSINVAVVAKSPIARVVELANGRGWRRFRLLSAADNTYQRDYRGEDAEGSQWPMANVFVRRDGRIHHFWGSEMLFADSTGDTRHIDMLWPLWNVLDLTPEGRGETWYPALSYPSVAPSGPAR